MQPEEVRFEVTPLVIKSRTVRQPGINVCAYSFMIVSCCVLLALFCDIPYICAGVTFTRRRGDAIIATLYTHTHGNL